jgi:hypothetical protein
MRDGAVLKNPCGVIVLRRFPFIDAYRFEPCGHPARYLISVAGDNLFAACHRHNRRIDRAFDAINKKEK